MILDYDEVGMSLISQKIQPDIQASVDRCKIPDEKLCLEEQLGKGNFGLVYKGVLTTPNGDTLTVAVKSLKGIYLLLCFQMFCLCCKNSPESKSLVYTLGVIVKIFVS